jgi:cation transport protein ChaC
MANPPPGQRIAPIDDEARARSLREALAAAPDPDVLRVFAYGSLMWRPEFAFAERELAVLDGYHRDFSIWSVFGRGSPEHPGLGFGLEEIAGARCTGILYRLVPGTCETDLVPLWEREMWTDTYRPAWVTVECGGWAFPALTFVVRPEHRQYAGCLPLAEKARYIAAATGKYGACRDYLADAVAHLSELGICDPDLVRLLDTVDALRA